MLNAAKLVASFTLSSPAVADYIDILVDLLLVRRLRPFHSNIHTRLAKAQKNYIGDGGLVQALLGIDGHETLIAHPVADGSWKRFAIENLTAAAPSGTAAGICPTMAAPKST